MTTKHKFFGAMLVLASGTLQAEVRLPAMISDHMVLQRDQRNPVWGWADPGEEVSVRLGDTRHTAVADAQGKWLVRLDAWPAGGPHRLTIQGKNTIHIEDVLIGEVWLCSGQSNMQWPVNSSVDADLERLSAHFPNIRLITVPQVGSQEPQDDFAGAWEACSPETVKDFSAVGYFFGRSLHQILQVPIGLIDNSWGGSSAEAWVRRDILAADDRYNKLLEGWAKTEEEQSKTSEYLGYMEKLEQWSEDALKARKAGQARPARPSPPRSPMFNQHRPGNLYNGVLKPVIGYGLRGAIWYQGESNAGRAYQYRHLFPLMISSWREEWRQGDFPFYWVQLADFLAEAEEPKGSAWAELREAQTLTMSALPKTGEAVIIDVGEGRDIHPRNKQAVAQRLVRWALANDYGVYVVHRSPMYKSMEKKDGKILLTFDDVGRGLYTFDVDEPLGFAIAGADQKFVWAEAKLVDKNKVEVWHESVSVPVAVRYAWADNPVANVQSREGLPMTPFRTDDWPGVTVEASK